ncbi:alpha/beta fold hydrolase [Sphingorhabdus sp.]|uniref:alpha/beta fold hydrolase n=1 Tax=Sphingorhabdus sp. TaxID=1902408 RepID=UPI003983B2A6
MMVSDSFKTVDGIDIAWRETGQGRPLLLIHGFMSEADTNWIKHGHAAVLADAGYRVIMPDLRAHGRSGKPRAAEHYPPDVLADDQFALLTYLNIRNYDLAGYSLGGRTVSRMLARQAKPGRAIISGMGLEGLTHTGNRGAYFREVFDNLGNHERGTAAWMAEAFLKTTGGDPAALRLVLDTFVDTSEADIACWTVPVAVVCGEQDDDNGSAAALAALLKRGKLFTVPGNHMSAVIKPELGQALVKALTGDIW